MRKQYLSAPLPFQGQKRRFAKEFINVLKNYPDDAVFVDLFGGSGLLLHITKYQKPNATVIYNDYDNYRKRLEAIPVTNALLAELRSLAVGIPRHKPIVGLTRERIFSCINKYERDYGFVDYITLSSSIMFSMKYATDLRGLEKETLYNNIRMEDYPPCDDYLDGLIITSEDYKNVFNRYKDTPGVVFLVDPPYLSTDTVTYRMYWKLADYLDVLNVLKGHDFIYFTSNKSSILELCEWIGRNITIGNPFEHCKKVEFNAQVNYSSTYTDIMLYTPKPLRTA